MISMGGSKSKPITSMRLNGLFSAGSLKLRFDSLHKKARRYALGFLFGRDGEIRTHDPLHPMQVRYRAALHPDFLRWLPNKIPVNGRMGTGHPLRDGKNKCYFLILVGTGINLNAESEFDFLILFRN